MSHAAKLAAAKRYLASRQVRAPIGVYLVPWKPPVRGEPLTLEHLRKK